MRRQIPNAALAIAATVVSCHDLGALQTTDVDAAAVQRDGGGASDAGDSSSSLPCSPGQTVCSGNCVDEQTDPFNCGRCGASCPAQASCHGGACKCPSGEVACGSNCVDEQTDKSNCGACGKACPVGGACESGTCTCPSGDTVCSGACVDPQTDDNNCGGCGRACPIGGTCQGVCTCPTGDTVCGGVCADLQTDPNNCGACGVVCAGVCSPGQCLVTLASGQPIPVAIAVDSTSVYWVDQMGSGGPGTFGGVVKVGLNGGTEAVLAWGRQVASGIALDATSVYWVDAGCPGDGGPCERAVLKVPLGGGALGTVVTGSPGDVAADGTNVYWTDSSAGTVMKVPAGGGAAVTLVSGQPGAGRILVDSTSVYWTAGGQLLSAPLAGGAATTLASANPNSLALGTSFIFWTDDSAGAVMSVGHHGGPVIPLVTGLTNPAGIAVDSAAVYWTMPGTMCTNSADGGVTCNGGVMKCSLAGCGGPPTTLASGQAALAIAVDDTSVYWTTGSSVMKLTPK